jgi:hypothetical protein
MTAITSSVHKTLIWNGVEGVCTTTSGNTVLVPQTQADELLRVITVNL